MKTCCRCKTTRDLCDFNRDSSFKDGLRPFCRECSKKEGKSRYASNINAERERNKVKYYKNQSYERDRKAKYYQDNKDKEKDRKAKYWQANKERLLDNAQRWQQNNPFYKAYKASKRRAAKRSASPNWLTKIHYQQIKWYYMAAKMMSETSGIVHEVDHIHPIMGQNFSGLHVPWNLRVISASDNKVKTNKPPSNEAHFFWI